MNKKTQKDLASQRRTIIGKYEKCRIKNTLLDLICEVQKKKQRKLDSISVNDNPYENIASIYNTNNDSSTRENSVLLRKLKLNDDSIVEVKSNTEEREPQLKLVRYSKLEYF